MIAVQMVTVNASKTGPKMWIVFMLWILMWSLPGTSGMWGRSQASFLHRRRWTRTVSAACQSLCSVYSWPKPAGCTDGFEQTLDRYSAWATGCQISQLERKTYTHAVHFVLFLFFFSLNNWDNNYIWTTVYHKRTSTVIKVMRKDKILNKRLLSVTEPRGEDVSLDAQ